MTDKIPQSSNNKESTASPRTSTLFKIGKVLLIVLGVIVAIILLALLALYITCSA